jgi:hypothetical protein
MTSSNVFALLLISVFETEKCYIRLSLWSTEDERHQSRGFAPFNEGVFPVHPAEYLCRSVDSQFVPVAELQIHNSISVKKQCHKHSVSSVGGFPLLKHEKTQMFEFSSLFLFRNEVLTCYRFPW